MCDNNVKSVLINKRPALFLAITSLIAVLISSTSLYLDVKYTFKCVLLICFLIIIVLIAFVYYSKLNGTVITCLMLFVFIFVSSSFLINKVNYENASLTGKRKFSGVIYNITSVKELENETFTYDIIVKGVLSNKKVKVKTNITTSYEIFIGNSINFSANIEKYNSYNDNYNPLISKVYYVGNNVKNLEIDENINGIFNKIKYKIYKNFKAVMPNNYHVAYAMLTGDTYFIDEYLLNDFRYLGIAHVFAVSGLHIGFLYSILFFIFKLFKLRGFKKFIPITIILFLYVWFCGFSPSCLRAFVIVSMLNLGDSFYLKTDKLVTLCLAFLICIFINPFDFYGVGFKLSFTVYSAIVFLSDKTAKILSKFTYEKVAKYLSTYVIASLASIPLLLDYFGYASAFTMLFNMFFVPILGFAYVLIFLLAIVSLVFPFYAIFSIIPNIILTFVTNIISLIETKLFILENIKFGISKMPYYSLGVINSGFINLTRKTSIVITVFLIIIVAFSLILVNVII